MNLSPRYIPIYDGFIINASAGIKYLLLGVIDLFVTVNITNYWLVPLQNTTNNPWLIPKLVH